VTKPERMIRWPEVRQRTGLSRTTIWRKVRQREFPAPIHLSSHAVGWRESEVESWLAERIQAREGANA
jgi:prophage regulatory protein